MTRRGTCKILIIGKLALLLVLIQTVQELCEYLKRLITEVNACAMVVRLSANGRIRN
jgi:hypothetical protein